MNQEMCPVCDEGVLKLSTFSDTFNYKANSVLVENLECTECDVCKSTPVLTQQILNNQLRIADGKRKTCGLLTSTEIKAVRKMYNLTQKQAAEIFGGGANAFSKYERGDVIQSEPMDKLLRLVFSDEKIMLKLTA